MNTEGERGGAPGSSSGDQEVPEAESTWAWGSGPRRLAEELLTHRAVQRRREALYNSHVMRINLDKAI